jgi:hypothetical protein
VANSGPGYLCTGLTESFFTGDDSAALGTPRRFDVTLGAFRVSLTGTPVDGGAGAVLVANPVLDIVLSHRTVFSGPLYDVTASLETGGKDNGRYPASLASVPLCVAQFPGDRTPTVLIDQSTGGTEHFLGIEAFHPSSRGGRWTSTSTAVIGSWTLGTVNDEVVIETGTLVYFFGPEVLSGYPIDLLQVQDDRFVDVTKRFPSVVLEDAKRQWEQFRTTHGLNWLAAWVVDECAVGKRAPAFKTVLQLEARHELNALPEYPAMPAGAAYVRYLSSVCLSTP